MDYNGSFPFLRIAKKYGLNYGSVLRTADAITSGISMSGVIHRAAYEDIVIACRREQERRAANCPDMTP